MTEGASKLDRSLDAAMRGTPLPGDADRDGDGNGNGKDGEAKEAGRTPGGGSGRDDKSNGDPSGNPGEGGGAADRNGGPEQRRVKVSGNLQARTDVREGERAVSAIDGMGRCGDPRPYREIFPSYDTAVEDGLREELVPAARRPAVRRYFSLIRPGDSPESRK
jgi:hypothetical protein